MRLVDVGGQLVEVQVRESARSRLIRAVYRPGQPAELVVPRGTSERAIDRALRTHAPWLGRQLANEKPRTLELPRMTERAGRRLARAQVTETALLEAARIGVAYRRIAIRDTRSRWGSCSSRGTLSFSWRLALAPRDVLDYVVVHELCHLVHHDHSRRFWSLVEHARPGYRAQRDWLQDHGWELLAYEPEREDDSAGRAASTGPIASLRRVPARWATFDCYGTLVDWNGGIRTELARLWPDEDADDLLRRYHSEEPDVQRENPAASYREVMARVLARLGDVPPGEEDALGRSLPRWNVFPEVPAALEEARRRGWRLAILSNTDRDLIDASKAAIGVPFDETVVASEIGSYKPAHRHWEEFYARTGADHARHVHVAQSVFHDVVPAKELGLPTVWINRLGEISDTKPTRELPDLERLADVLDDLIPA